MNWITSHLGLQKRYVRLMKKIQRKDKEKMKRNWATIKKILKCKKEYNIVSFDQDKTSSDNNDLIWIITSNSVHQQIMYGQFYQGYRVE